MRTSSTTVVLALLLAVFLGAVFLGDGLAAPAVAAGRTGPPAAARVVAINSALLAQQPPGATTTPPAPNGTGPGTSKQQAQKNLWLVLIAAALFGLVYTGRRVRKARKKPTSG